MKANKELQIFDNPDFGEIRTLFENGTALLCGNDVAKVLGYSNPSKALSGHCRCVTKRYIPHPQSPDKTIEMSFIPESDLYRLIFSSKLPSAEKFTDWVTEEVLPSIRKTGEYKTPAKAMTEYQQGIVNARQQSIAIQKARLLNEIAAEYDGTYRQVLQAHATKELTGEFLLPLPRIEQLTYSAGEIGEQLGISGNKVGILTNRHKLKTEQYGAWFADTAKGHHKQVQTFRYYPTIIPVLRDILTEGVEDA